MRGRTTERMWVRFANGRAGNAPVVDRCRVRWPLSIAGVAARVRQGTRPCGAAPRSPRTPLTHAVRSGNSFRYRMRQFGQLATVFKKVQVIRPLRSHTVQLLWIFSKSLKATVVNEFHHQRIWKNVYLCLCLMFNFYQYLVLYIYFFTILSFYENLSCRYKILP